MAALQFRFTLSHFSAGTQVISEPIGWKEIEFNLERHPEFHSLIESIDVPIELYGSDGANDGGYDFFKLCLNNGIDKQIGLQIEVKELDNGAYEDLFVGQLQTHLYKDFPYLKKIQVPIARSDTWAKFIGRRAVPIDLKSATSVDGDALTVRDEFTLPLPPQIMRQRYEGRHFDNVDYATTTTGGFIYGIIDFEATILDEIEEKFDYPRVATNARPFELLAMEYDGEYQFDSSISLTTDMITWGFPVNSQIFFQVNDDTPVAFTETDLGTPGVDGRTKYEYSDSHTLQKGDFVRIYIQSADPCSWVGSFDTNFLTVAGDTSYMDTTAPAFLAHDAGLSIVDRLLGRDESFYSEYFGGGITAIPYPLDGCGYPHALTKGLHVRGFSLADKPYRMSFDDWWSGLNPIFALGVGYENLAGSPDAEVIRVERLIDFFDTSSDSVSLTNVDGEKIEISVDDDLIIKKVRAGYQKWEAEAASGIDDPQTVHDYTTTMRIVGNDKDLLSSFYAASLGIEQTRRNRVDQGRDWRLDEETMIIQMDMGSTPEQPATYADGDFTNLLNGGSRYNVRLDPYMHMSRWMNFLGISIVATACGQYNFAGGEGNTNMTFADGVYNDCERPFNSNDFATIGISEQNPRHSEKIYRFTHTLTYTQYKAIIADRKKKIGVSYINHATGATVSISGFIKKMTYAINNGMAKFEIWKI